MSTQSHDQIWSVATDEPQASTASTGLGMGALDARRRTRLSSVMRGLLAVLSVVVVILLARDSIPQPGAVARAVREANLWWVALAVVLQFISLCGLAIQQRGLLATVGTGVGPVRMAAITAAGTALAMTMPVGGAVGAGWSFRQYRRLGASRAAAGAVTAASGLAAALALVVLGVVMWPTAQILAALAPQARTFWVACSVMIPIAALVGAAGLAWSRRGCTTPPDLISGSSVPPDSSKWWRFGHEIRSTTSVLRALGRRPWGRAVAVSAVSRMLDIGCLYACCVALGASADFILLALVYLGIQLLRQLPLTPGGVGVVEVALLTGLATIGVAAGPATAAVLAYRLLSGWLLVPLGYIALITLHTGDRRPQPGRNGPWQSPKHLPRSR